MTVSGARRAWRDGTTDRYIDLMIMALVCATG
jgi:hypothetical protein